MDLPEHVAKAHISRSFRGGGHPVENECPCEQEPCGYVARDKVHPDCTEHTLTSGKTIRDSHAPEDCTHA